MFWRRRRASTGRISVGVVVVLIACAVVAATGAGQAAARPAAGSAMAGHLPCNHSIRFADATFSNPTSVTNQFYPLVPGTKLVYEGTAEGVPHRVVFIVTDLTKVIAGVRTIVFWERDFSEGTLVETELAFRAQDDAGNVWHMGEYPESYEDGEFIEALAWFAGIQRAQPGTIMLADPKRTFPKYLQGFAPRVDFLDCAKVRATGRNVTVPAGSFSNVLVIDETSPRDPEGGVQRKFYAPGIGNIKVSDPLDPSGEFLELVSIQRLDGDDMQDVREAAFRLERRAYEISEAYQQTPPMQPLP